MSGRKSIFGGNCNREDRKAVFLVENVLSFGRRLVFPGKNSVFLEGNVVFRVAMWYFWEERQST